MRSSLYVVLLSALFVGCKSSSNESGDFPLDEIAFTSSAAIDPVTKKGRFSIGTLSVGINTESGSSSTFIASAPDTLSGGDRYTATTDVGRWSVPQAAPRVQGFEYADNSELSFGFYRNNSLANEITVTPNPLMLPVISASPALLNRDAKSTEVTLQFPGLPDNYELPTGVQLSIGNSNLVCYQDNEIVIDLFEEENLPSSVPFDFFFGPNWPVSIKNTSVDTLTQQLDVGQLIPTIADVFITGDPLDSCTIDVLASVIVNLSDIERNQTDISDIAEITSNGLNPENRFRFAIISESFPITIDRSVFEMP